MLPKKHKTILDTNLLLQFLLQGKLETIGMLLDEGAIQLLISAPQLAEIKEVTGCLQSRRVISKKQQKGLLKFVNRSATNVLVHTPIQFDPSPNAGFLLATAIDSNADYLITLDDKLLALSPFRGTKIITHREFLEGILAD